MIIPVYKPLGASSHMLAAAVGRSRGEKATHTGTLDPMAEGVLVVLTGEDRFKKSQLSNVQKTYTFRMLFGVSTDTHDLLGIPTQVMKKNELDLSLKEITHKVETLLQEFSGEVEQVQPLFSAGRVGGKSFFEYGTQKQQIPLPTNTVTFLSNHVETIETLELEKLQNYLEDKIARVEGSFRQEEVLSAWKKVLLQLSSEADTHSLPLLTITSTVTKRTYIRALVRDISAKMALPATTFSIIRTKNGSFSIEDCVSNIV